MMALQRRLFVWVCAVGSILVVVTCSPAADPRQVVGGSLRQEQCPLGEEVELGGRGGGGGRRVMMVQVVGGLGAAAARTSCNTHHAAPLFLNTQDDADILHRLLKDCIKTGKLYTVWVPARRHAQHKRIERPLVESAVTSYGNVEYDWMSAHYNRTTDNIYLLSFPEKVNQRKGIICVRKPDQQ